MTVNISYADSSRMLILQKLNDTENDAIQCSLIAETPAVPTAHLGNYVYFSARIWIDT